MRPAVVGPKLPVAIPVRRLGGPGVVDGVVLEVVGQTADPAQAARSAWRERCRAPPPSCPSATGGSGNGYAGSARCRMSSIGRLRSMRNHGRRRARRPWPRAGTAPGHVSSCSRNTPFGGDLGEDLAVGAARHADADGQARAVAGQADHPHIMAEILAAELRADAERAGSAPAPSASMSSVAERMAGRLLPLGRQGRRGSGWRRASQPSGVSSALVPPMAMARW